MAKPWSQVVQSPEFKSLSIDDQEAARRQYFDTVVAPKVPKEDLDFARNQFNSSTQLAPQKVSTPPGLAQVLYNQTDETKMLRAGQEAGYSYEDVDRAMTAELERQRAASEKRTLGNVAADIVGQVVNRGKPLGGLVQSVGDFIAPGPDKPIDTFRDQGGFNNVRQIIGKGLSQYGGEIYDEGAGVEKQLQVEMPNSTLEGLYGGVKSFARQAPTLFSPFGTATTLGEMGAEVGFDKYAEARKAGYSPTMSTAVGVGHGGIEVATEYLPTKYLKEALAGKITLKTFIKDQLAELGGEQFATLGQDAIDQATGLSGKEKGNWEQYWRERPDAAYQTLLATLAQSGITVGGVKIADALRNSTSAQLRQLDQDINTAEWNPEQIDAVARQSLAPDQTLVPTVPATVAGIPLERLPDHLLERAKGIVDPERAAAIDAEIARRQKAGEETTTSATTESPVTPISEAAPIDQQAMLAQLGGTNAAEVDATSDQGSGDLGAGSTAAAPTDAGVGERVGGDSGASMGGRGADRSVGTAGLADSAVTPGQLIYLRDNHADQTVREAAAAELKRREIEYAYQQQEEQKQRTAQAAEKQKVEQDIAGQFPEPQGAMANALRNAGITTETVPQGAANLTRFPAATMPGTVAPVAQSQGATNETSQAAQTNVAGVGPQVQETAGSYEQVAATGTRVPRVSSEVARQKLASEIPGVEFVDEVAPVLGNPVATKARRNEAKILKRLFNAFGLELHFVNLPKGKGFGGVHYRSIPGHVFVNAAHLSRSLRAIAGHESLHNLRTQSPELYNKLVQALQKYGAAKLSKKEFQPLYDARKGGTKLPDQDTATEEQVANLWGDMLHDPKHFNELLNNVFGDDVKGAAKVVATIRKAIKSLIDNIKALGNGYDTTKYQGDLKEVQRELMAAFTAYAKAHKVSAISAELSVAREEQGLQSPIEDTVANENREGVIVGARPGEFDWSVAQGGVPAPIQHPVQLAPRVDRLGPAVGKILNSKAVKQLVEDLFGITNLKAYPTLGQYKGKPEPSFTLYGDGMTFEAADGLSRLLGFAFAQESTIVTQPVYAGDEDTWPAFYMGNGKKLTAKEVEAVRKEAQNQGLDYSTSIDGKFFKFFFDGSDYDSYVGKVRKIAEAAGLKDIDEVATRSQFNEAEAYLESGDRSGQRQVWYSEGASGSSSLFGRAVDHLLVPYAKAVGAEGYRFSPDLFADRFGLSPQQREYLRAALRPKDGKKLSTAAIVAGREKVEATKSDTRSKTPKSNNTDVMWALQNRAAAIGQIEPGDYSDEAKKAISEAMADEVIEHISRPGGKSAIGWHDAALKKAKQIYDQVFPELNTNKDREMLFDALLGITSQGNDVHSNSIYAGRMYYLITRKGMTISQAEKELHGTFGGETRAIENNFLKLEELLDRNGYDRMRQLFNKKMTVGEWNALLRRDKTLYYGGEPLKMDGAARQKVNGWMVFGPKIGSFINNLHGDYSTLTADLWFSRTWNRILGFSFLHTPMQEAAKYQAFKEALIAEHTKTTDPRSNGKAWEHGEDIHFTDDQLDKLMADPDAMLALAQELYDYYKNGFTFSHNKEDKKNGFSTKSDLRRASKNWIEHRNDSVAAPRNDNERAFQQETVEAAQRIIKRKTGENITIADIQAALWYHEKELFAHFGATDKKKKPADYADAAQGFMEKYNDGDLFYVEKPSPKYIYGKKGDYLKGQDKGLQSPLVEAWQEIAQHEDAFSFPKSESKDFEQIMAGIDPDIRVSERGVFDDKTAKRFVVTMPGPNRKTADVFVGKNGEMWVNASQLQVGISKGVALYAGMLNYAHNNGLVLKGDPLGVSTMATFRRTENMLSAALKFGATSFMEPADTQRSPQSFKDRIGYSNGVITKMTPVQWVEGNDNANLESLLKASLENVAAFVPEIKDVVYNRELQDFVRAGQPDRVVTRAEWNGMSGRLLAGLEGVSEPGEKLDRILAKVSGKDQRSKTLERAAISNTLLREGSGEGRGSLLAETGGKLHGRLNRVLYSPIEETIDVDGIERPLQNANGQRIHYTDEGVRNFWRWMDGTNAQRLGRASAKSADNGGLSQSSERNPYVAANLFDRLGRPRVFFHGSSSDFASFDFDHPGRKDQGWLGRGAYLTSDIDTAEVYAKQKAGPAAENVMPLYVALHNPLIADADTKQLFRKQSKSAIDKWTDEMIRRGYDGTILQFDDGHVEVVAFNKSAVKSASGNSGEFNENNPDIRYSPEPAPAFYSQLARSFERAPDRIYGPAQQVKAWLASNAAKLGVKQDEIQWTGINEWLDLQGKTKVTKQQVLDYLAQGGVKVEEVMKGSRGFSEKNPSLPESGGLDVVPWENLPDDAARELEDKAVYGRYVVLDNMDTPLGIGPTEADAINDAYSGYPHLWDTENSTKYGDYTLPGGENYRELLLTLPQRVDDSEYRRLEDAAYEAAQNGDREEFRRLKEEAEKVKPGPAAEYKSGHWDEANILAHIRFNDRTDANGAKTLFVEEIQSDLAQDKRKGKTDFNGPFIDKTEAWVDLALKRIAMYAVEHGYDKVAFVTGQQSADRYDLSKQVDELVAYDDNTLVARQGGRNVIERPFKDEADLSSLIGKETAAKLLSTEPDMNNQRILRGKDLKVGGTGMKTFYDAIVPQRVKEVLKKLGGEKMENVTLGSNDKLRTVRDDDGTYALEEKRTDEWDESYWEPIAFGLTEAQASKHAADDKRSQQPGFTITPAMREKVSEGVPLFSPLPGVSPMPEETRGQQKQREIQDKFNRYKTLAKWAADNGLQLSEQANVYMAEERYHGRVATRLEDFREKMVKPIIQKVQKAGFTMQDVADFLEAQHTPEANAQARKLQNDPKATAAGLTDQEAQTYLANASPELKRLANEFRQITERTKQLLLRTGIIDQDTANAWDATYQHYVPLKGGEDSKASRSGTGSGMSVNGKQKRRLGHGKRDEHVIENIIRDYEKAVIASEKNLVGQHLIALALELQKLDPDLITVGKPEKRKVLMPGKKTYAVTYHGSVVASFENQNDAARFISQIGKQGMQVVVSQGDPYIQLMAAPMLQENEATVYVAGQAVRVQINDEILARAYKNMGVESLNAILQVSRNLNTWLSKAYTGYNPEFVLVNMARDFTGGTINLMGNYGEKVVGKTLKNYPKAFMSILRYSMTGKATADIQQYRDNGGSTGAAYLSDIERVGKDVEAAYNEYVGVMENVKHGNYWKAARAAGRERIGKALGWIEHLNAASENAMRLAAFMAVRDTTGSVAKGASAAKNVTVNFNRKGEMGSQLGALYLFANPNIQGTQNLFQTLFKSEHKGKAWALVGGMVALAALAAAQFDDDEWKDIPDSEKDRNLIIRAGDSRIKIPVPYGYGFFFGLGNVYRNIQAGDSVAKVAAHLASSFFEHFSPIGNPMQSPITMLPTAIKIPMEPLLNVNDFGRKIVPEYGNHDEGRPDFLKMNRTTKGGSYAWLAQTMSSLTGGTKGTAGWIDVSPETLKYWSKTMTGGTGAFYGDLGEMISTIAQGAMPEVHEIPIARKFYGEPRINDVRQRYYKSVKDAENALAALNVARKENDQEGAQNIRVRDKELIALARAAEATKKAFKANRDRQVQMLNDESKSLAYRRAAVKEMERREEELYRRILKSHGF